MSQHDFPIEVFAHFAGLPEVLAPSGFKVDKVPTPPEPGLEPPEALVVMEPGELTVLQMRSGDTKPPLVFASHGRRADLTSKRSMIEAARAANRKIEVHVFDKPSGS